MKIKKIMLFLSLLTIVTLMITPAFAGDVPYESDLIAGQHHMVGDVQISFTSDAHKVLRITLETDDCDIVETHIWVGANLEDVPKTKSGNPKIGHFPCAEKYVDSTKEVTVEIPIDVDEIARGDCIYVLIHAVVDCPCMGKETAWGEGWWATPFSENQDIFGNRWGYYITITR